VKKVRLQILRGEFEVLRWRDLEKEWRMFESLKRSFVPCNKDFTILLSLLKSREIQKP
jgi:hypothetical protein